MFSRYLRSDILTYAGYFLRLVFGWVSSEYGRLRNLALTVVIRYLVSCKIDLSHYATSLLFLVEDGLYLKGPEELNYRLSIVFQSSRDRLSKCLIVLKPNRNSEVGTESSSKRIPRPGSSESFLICSRSPNFSNVPLS